MTRTASIFLTVVLVAGCSASDDDSDDKPAETADAYALELSGGVTTGCSQAAPGAEAEANPGCIYSVAFAGCLEGLTGEPVGPLPVEEEFPNEPALVEIHRQAVTDCSPENGE